MRWMVSLSPIVYFNDFNSHTFFTVSFSLSFSFLFSFIFTFYHVRLIFRIKMYSEKKAPHSFFLHYFERTANVLCWDPRLMEMRDSCSCDVERKQKRQQKQQKKSLNKSVQKLFRQIIIIFHPAIRSSNCMRKRTLNTINTPSSANVPNTNTECHNFHELSIKITIFVYISLWMRVVDV